MTRKLLVTLAKSAALAGTAAVLMATTEDDCRGKGANLHFGGSCGSSGTLSLGTPSADAGDGYDDFAVTIPAASGLPAQASGQGCDLGQSWSFTNSTWTMTGLVEDGGTTPRTCVVDGLIATCYDGDAGTSVCTDQFTEQ